MESDYLPNVTIVETNRTYRKLPNGILIPSVDPFMDENIYYELKVFDKQNNLKYTISHKHLDHIGKGYWKDVEVKK